MTTTFTVSDDDPSTGMSAMDKTTSVVATAVDDPPGDQRHGGGPDDHRRRDHRAVRYRPMSRTWMSAFKTT